MKDEIKNYYVILGIDESASLDEIKQAYQDLNKVWAIDKFRDDPRLLSKAQQNLTEINEAYKKLSEHDEAKSKKITVNNAFKISTEGNIAEKPAIVSKSMFSVIGAVVLIGILVGLAFVNRYSIETVGDYIVKYDRFTRTVYVRQPNNPVIAWRDWRESDKSYDEVISECRLRTEDRKRFAEESRRRDEEFQKFMSNMYGNRKQNLEDTRKDERTRDIIREELEVNNTLRK